MPTAGTLQACANWFIKFGEQQNFRSKKSFSSKKCWAQEYFGSERKFDSKIILVEHNFGLTKDLGQENFWANLGPN